MYTKFAYCVYAHECCYGGNEKEQAPAHRHLPECQPPISSMATGLPEPDNVKKIKQENTAHGEGSRGGTLMTYASYLA